MTTFNFHILNTCLLMTHSDLKEYFQCGFSIFAPLKHLNASSTAAAAE